MNETAPRAATLSSRQENEAAARSRIYTLLGEALAYPRGDNVLRLLDGDWLAELTQAIEHSGLSIDCPAQLTLPEGQRAIETLEQEYSNLFDVLGGTPRVSMLERAYVDQNEQALWQELLGFYRHFGLDFSQGYAEEQPDHLLTELAFMHYLCFLEAGARVGKDDYRRGQLDFLAGHLSGWVSTFVECLQEVQADSVYAEFGAVMSSVANAHMESLDL